MDLKKLGKALLFPHIAIMIALIPIATVLLVCSMVFIGTETAISYISYVLAAYTLTVWCMKIPNIIRFFKRFKSENKFAIMWFSDARLRINVTLFAALIGNTIYGIFHIFLGLKHHTFWFYSLGAYYICLAFMRFGLVRHTSKFAPGEKMHTELVKYRATGWVFLVMNTVISLMIFFMVYWNRTFEHHMITAIAMAAYTFTSFTTAVINVIKYRKYNSPVFSASKAISFASACVSVLTLEATMITTFGKETMDNATRRIMLGATGGVISVFIIAIAIYMIVIGTKKLHELKAEIENGKQQ